MFQRRNQHSLKRALDQASDGELRDLQEELNWRQERVAQLEFELSDTNANLGRFNQKLEDRLGALQTRLEELELEVEQARLRAARRVTGLILQTCTSMYLSSIGVHGLQRKSHHHPQPKSRVFLSRPRLS
jgi:predicted nuclease with TOPRIM domain